MMSASSSSRPDVECHPVTPERWPDLETLFGPRGATGGCWCMYWRLPRAILRTNREAHQGSFAAFRGERRNRWTVGLCSGPAGGLVRYRATGELSSAGAVTHPQRRRCGAGMVRRVFFCEQGLSWERCDHGHVTSCGRVCQGTWGEDCRGLSHRAEDPAYPYGLSLDWAGLGLPASRLRRSRATVGHPSSDAIRDHGSVRGHEHGD
jgi:hypothetical protein